MIHPSQVLSKFNEGLDTFEIAKFYLISEAQAYALLDQARREKFNVNLKFGGTDSGRAKGLRNLQIAKRKTPVSLAPVRFLEAK